MISIFYPTMRFPYLRQSQINAKSFLLKLFYLFWGNLICKWRLSKADRKSNERDLGFDQSCINSPHLHWKNVLNRLKRNVFCFSMNHKIYITLLESKTSSWGAVKAELPFYFIPQDLSLKKIFHYFEDQFPIFIVIIGFLR